MEGYMVANDGLGASLSKRQWTTGGGFRYSRNEGACCCNQMAQAGKAQEFSRQDGNVVLRYIKH